MSRKIAIFAYHKKMKTALISTLSNPIPQATLTVASKETEKHPLEPFLPRNARLLMLGSFPPTAKRWSMDFYYPNFQNDMWRIMGYLFFDDIKHFYSEPNNNTKPSFNKGRITAFCSEKGIAIYDTACEICRLKGTAADNDLEIIRATDISFLLARIPDCRTIAATGGKASLQVASFFQCKEPPSASFTTFDIDSEQKPNGGSSFTFWRMPSTSRAYPIPLEKKAACYKKMFLSVGIL